MLGELLEHVLDPMDVIGTLQMVLKPGGLVIITMPWGPWETGYGNKPQHIREWTAADLQDVFGEQADLVIDTVPCDENPHVGESRGYTVCSFRANGIRFGSIDWSRKLAAQPYTFEIFRDVGSSQQYAGCNLNTMNLIAAFNQELRAETCLLYTSRCV